MKTIAKMNALKNSIYLLVVLAILLFLIVGKRNSPVEQISLEEINALEVDRMIVTSNGKQTEELDIHRIRKFLEIIKGCSNPIELRKMRVIDNYKVHLKVGEKVAVFNFHKKNMMPFMMNKSVVGQTYECNQMESFLVRYK